MLRSAHGLLAHSCMHTAAHHAWPCRRLFAWCRMHGWPRESCCRAGLFARHMRSAGHLWWRQEEARGGKRRHGGGMNQGLVGLVGCGAVGLGLGLPVMEGATAVTLRQPPSEAEVWDHVLSGVRVGSVYGCWAEAGGGGVRAPAPSGARFRPPCGHISQPWHWWAMLPRPDMPLQRMLLYLAAAVLHTYGQNPLRQACLRMWRAKSMAAASSGPPGTCMRHWPASWNWCRQARPVICRHAAVRQQPCGRIKQIAFRRVPLRVIMLPLPPWCCRTGVRAAGADSATGRPHAGAADDVVSMAVHTHQLESLGSSCNQHRNWAAVATIHRNGFVQRLGTGP